MEEVEGCVDGPRNEEWVALARVQVWTRYESQTGSHCYLFCRSFSCHHLSPVAISRAPLLSLALPFLSAEIVNMIKSNQRLRLRSWFCYERKTFAFLNVSELSGQLPVSIRAYAHCLSLKLHSVANRDIYHTEFRSAMNSGLSA